MARNWKAYEAVQAIKSGSKEDKIDIGRRFPLFAMMAVQLNEAGVELASCLPDYCTARKIESMLKGDATDTEEGAPETDGDVEDEKPAKEKGKGKAKEADEEKGEYDDKSAKELFDLCKAAGIKVKPKQDKEVYIKALEDAAAKSKAKQKANDDEDDWGDDEEEEKPAKKSSKGKGKAKPADDEDDDDEWNI